MFVIVSLNDCYFFINVALRRTATYQGRHTQGIYHYEGGGPSQGGSLYVVTRRHRTVTVTL